MHFATTQNDHIFSIKTLTLSTHTNTQRSCCTLTVGKVLCQLLRLIVWAQTYLFVAQYWFCNDSRETKTEVMTVFAGTAVVESCIGHDRVLVSLRHHRILEFILRHTCVNFERSIHRLFRTPFREDTHVLITNIYIKILPDCVRTLLYTAE